MRVYRRLPDAEVNDLHVLAREGVIELEETQIPDDEFRVVEMAWLEGHRFELAELYPGEWIAIVGAKLVAHAADVGTLMRQIAEAGSPDPFITAVPTPGTPHIFIG